MLHQRKNYFLAIFTAVLFMGTAAMGQGIYVWNQAGGGNFTTAGNWTPARFPLNPADQLIINNGGTQVITAIPTQTIGKLTISGNTNVTFQGPAGFQTLTIQNLAGTDLTVAAGSTLNIDVTYNSVVLAANATADISGTYINNTNFDLSNAGVVATITGAFTNRATITGSTAAKLLIPSGGIYRHNQTAGTIPTAGWAANSTLEFSNGGSTAPAALASTTFGKIAVSNSTNVSLSGTGGPTTITISNGTGNDLDVASGSTLAIASTLETTTLAAGSNAIINGTFQNGAAFTGSTAANLVFSSTGSYVHAQNGGTIPLATWAATSTCNISGITNAMPANISQNYGNLLWSSPGQTANLAFNAAMSIQGNFTVDNTSASLLLLTDNTTSRTFAIGGNMVIQNVGEFTASDAAGSAAITVAGNYSQTGGGSNFRLSDGANTAASTLAVTGDLTQTGGDFRIVNGTGAASTTVNGNLSISGGEIRVVSGAGAATLNVTGNLNISGTGLLTVKEDAGNAAVNVTGNFVKTGGTVDQRTLSAAGTSIVTVTGNFSHSLGTYDMSNVAAASSTLNVAGNFSHTGGTITETGGTTANGAIFFTGTAPQIYTSGGTTSNTINLTVNTGATLQMAAAATVVNGAAFTLSSGATLGIRSAGGIAVAGVTAGNIRTTARTYNVGGNYLYNGTAAQITGSGFPTNLTGDLIVNNPGFTVTLDAEGAAPDARSIASGGLINLTAGTFASGTNLTMATGSSFTRSAGILTGTFAGGDYDVEYTGNTGTTGPELQGGQAGGTRLRNLTINRTIGQSVTLIAPTSMKGELTLNTGFLALGANILEMTATATCTNGGNPNSFVSGRMRKIGVSDFVFPIGLSTYKPVGFSGSSTSFTADLSASATIEALSFNLNPLKAVVPKVLTGSLLSLTNCFLWQIDREDAGTNDIFIWTSTGPGGGAFSTENLTRCFDPGSPSTTIVPADLRVARHTGAVWQDLGQGIQAERSNAWFISAGLASPTFSPFTVGSAQNVLPVSLASFTASKQGSSVDLKWTTASEQNNAYFEVLRSADGANFSAIGKVNGAGNSSSRLNYKFTDNSPLVGKNFYRLRQVDFDGAFDLSAIVSVNMSVNSTVSLYPNPVTNTALLQYPKAVKGAGYRLVAMDGRVMKSGILQENSTQMNLNLSGMQSGTYVLIINNNGEQYHQRIQKQ